jgi:hypothetical protein
MSDNENPRSRPSKDRGGGGGDAENNGGDLAIETSPGEAYMIYIEMNNLANKLKLLNYEDDYLIKWKMKPLSKYTII